MGPAQYRAQQPAQRVSAPSLDTRVGTIDVAVPKLRSGSYFPEWLLERRKRAESALITVVADCYLAGVSTRRMDKLVKTLGIDSLSKSQVSRMAAELDEQVAAFRHRRLDTAGPFTFVAADALTMKVRENKQVVSAVAMIATGVNADGHREVLGLHVATSETGRHGTPSSPTWSPAAWPACDCVTSDAHKGLVEGNRGEPARCWLAALPHPLRGEPDGCVPQEHVAGSESDVALGLRPARRQICCCTV